MKDSPQYVPISVRVPAELASALRAAAGMGDRTFSAEVRRALRRHIQGETRGKIAEMRG